MADLTDDELPPLPEARKPSPNGLGWFTAGQVRAAQRAAIAADRERRGEPVAVYHAYPAHWQAKIEMLPGVPILPDGTKLYTAPPAAQPVEMSPEFTDTARAALLWVLWHHQGSSSPVGQPLRFALGMGAHEHLNEREVNEAKRWAALLTKSETADFHRASPPTAQSVPAAQGWQPIETAPKDGSLFLCWVSAVRYGETDDGQQYQQDVSQVDFCNWRTQADIPDSGWFDPCCGQIGDQQRVTHWMLLPAAPTAPKHTKE